MPSLRYNVFTVCRLISSLATVDLPHLRPLHDHSYSLILNPLQPVVCLKRDQKGLVSCHQVVTKYFTIMGECYYHIDIIYIIYRNTTIVFQSKAIISSVLCWQSLVNVRAL